ncbi:saccharopine dehydrogenase NADP-binding domain-containing protein [Sphingobium sp. HBC34]|uniref:Saccharopine dehydrogenase NADP-binding domain-containing protein n=1 Tax=Sphingobium cyanobacteriorum TaxID=3063954 RepID=A0ABT8ZQR4_9SPHN|nr:saccharopine dehydrogenase NADP-binding domain-containing protein [Sphingobium sp. HBC34]MDO7836423.1 saccharopine dehydrogenase NADP-binding domain-containing protein [Sphingobium sp. HBC34]
MTKLLIYGATGYTGQMIARLAAQRGLNFRIGGRSRDKVDALASALDVEGVVLDVNDKAALDAVVQDADCVINGAGPFAATASQVIGACIANRAHYIDITGEVDVFSLAETLDVAAQEAGVMIMPGAGWDVVPSDCIARYVAQKISDPVSLRIGLAHINGIPSRGTLRTGLAALGRQVVRRDDKLVVPDEPDAVVEMNFGYAVQKCRRSPLGDVVTARKSTGIPNIEVFMAGGAALKMPDGGVEAFPEGPSDEQLARWRAFAAAEVIGRDGSRASAVVETGSGYGFTAKAAVDIAARILDGRLTPGFQSPASAYGARLVSDLGGVITDFEPAC